MKISEVGGKYELHAEASSLRLKPLQLGTEIRSITSGDQQFISSLPSLLSDGVFERDGEDIVASIENLIALEEREFDPLRFVLDWSPFALKIEGRGSLGFDDFKFVPRFYLGKRVVQVRTVGVAAWRSQSIYRIPGAQAIALSLIEFFNNLPGEAKTKARSLDALYQLKILAKSDADISFDKYLASENVVKPTSVGLKAHDESDRAVIYPTVEGVSEDAFKKQFLNISEVQDVYDVDVGGSERHRVLISEEIKSVLKSVKKNGFGISGIRREQFYRNPRSILPEGEDQNPDLIQVAGFGPRVKGVGYASFARPITSATKEKWFGEVLPEGAEREEGPSMAIECDFVDGESKTITFETVEKAEEFYSEVAAQLALGKTSVEWDNTSIPISPTFVSQVAEEIQKLHPNRGGSTVRESTKPYRLLIHTNEAEIDYAEDAGVIETTFDLEMPSHLKTSVTLKDHQTSGVRWLAGLLNRNLARGALLADDMGLGKTLQLLTFLAWCIESEMESLKSDAGPYDPVLVVAPLILLDNWEREIKSYFEPGLFSPIEKLHGSSLSRYRKADRSGRETDPSRETLSIDLLRTNRIIITNYETVKNYQYTFAKVPWSVVVIDEAQEIKEPSTAITYALKALNPTFRIASTGTPVETSLTNLWSIMDFAQPGNNLGSLRAFNKNFGEYNFDDPTLGLSLRKALGFNTESGLVLRRSKKEVLKDLPTKTTVEHECALDANTRSKYEGVLEFVRKSKKGSNAALQGIHQLAMISQHPFLIEAEPFRNDYREYVSASTKLQKLLEVLRDVKGKSEKALVFTRSRRMQDILKSVLDAEFGLDVGIVNGETSSKHKYVAKTRQGIIDRFSGSAGFDALILSPEVAGVGLTITAASHVIHYGRWWNPAKENQATDRAYRIGQTKPVFVHHLILRDESKALETFDEKLHRLLKSREDLADNFLVPAGDDRVVHDGLLDDIFSDKPNTETNKRAKTDIVSISELTPFQFECAVAILMRKRCEHTFVTPRTGDRGIDVVGISANEVVLIQCKKISQDSQSHAEVLDELTDGTDFYREHVLPKSLKHLPIKSMLFTTGRIDRALAKAAKGRGIEIVDTRVLEKLVSNVNISLSEVQAMENSRPRNVDALGGILATLR